jgi:hypothetical protein
MDNRHKTPDEMYLENVQRKLISTINEVGPEQFMKGIAAYIDNAAAANIGKGDIPVIGALLTIHGRRLPHRSHRRWGQNAPAR